MLTGCLPFEGKNPAQVLRKVLEGVFLPAERQLPKAGALYGAIAEKALARDPADRFASAGAMGSALEQELLLAKVTDVREEISQYLNDPKVYSAKHNETLPDLLVLAASQARQKRDMVRAASLFNRALAYRPNDTRLLAEVAGLARRDRVRRRLISGAVLTVVILGLLGAGAATLGLIEQQDASSKGRSTKAPALNKPAPSPSRVAVKPKVTPAPRSDLPSEPAQDVVDVSSRPRAPALARPSPVVVPGKRVVRTPVVGPQNARVRIDGEQRTWYEPHYLELGPHTFEFIPPNNECCESSPPRTVEVVAGEGEQVVRGVIRFRSAVLRLQGTQGSRASCGIGDVIVAGTEREIPMNRPSRALSCTVFPPPNLPGDPRTVDVTLSPGRTFTLSSQ
jgi:hypothetical protein